ncbi:MAG: hypothetical protein WD770_05625 [Actinomycetota bacterium]
MKVTLLLADAAHAVDNKLYILGGGWSVTGPDPVPFAIAMKVEVPWDRTNERHSWILRLLDADGRPVSVETGQGGRAVEISGEFEVGRPPGIPPGTPIDLSLAINSGPIPIPPGGRYVWRLAIDDEQDSDWEVGFTTRPAAAG